MTAPPLLRSMLATALLAATALSAHADDTRERELAAARADLQRAATRLAELSRADGIGAVTIQRRPVVGVVLAGDDREGARISAVTPDGAAAKAGLRAGDRLVTVGGTRILGSTGTLRVDNARKLLAAADSDKPLALGYLRDGRTAKVDVVPTANRHVFLQAGGQLAQADAVLAALERDGTFAQLANVRAIDGNAIARETNDAVRTLMIQRSALGSFDADCKGDGCASTRVLSALRWNGLNLATLDPQLGRYFGTTRGTLVLSSGGIDGLESGDVIQKVDGKAVDTPAALMAALRDRPADARVPVELLRERRAVKAQVTLPGRLHALPPEPPAPPAPPAPPPPPPAPPKPKTAALDLHAPPAVSAVHGVAPVPAVAPVHGPQLALHVPAPPPLPPVPPAPPRID